MASAYFLHQIKHTSGNWEKGIVIKSIKFMSNENYIAKMALKVL